MEWLLFQIFINNTFGVYIKTWRSEYSTNLQCIMVKLLKHTEFSTHHTSLLFFLHSDCTGGCYSPPDFFFYTFGNWGTKKRCKFAQASYQDNNGGSPGKPKTSFSEPAIMITVFWHSIHRNLNIALTNFIPKVSCKACRHHFIFLFREELLKFFF